MKGLSLLANDEADLALISACLQDALIPLAEMHFDAEEQRFYMMANRFQWERAMRDASGKPALRQEIGDADFADSDELPGDGRRNAAIRIDNVVTVRSKGINLKEPGKFLSLLAIQRDADHLNLIFAGGGVIQLEVTELALALRDLGSAWPTQWRPEHEANPRNRG